MAHDHHHEHHDHSHHTHEGPVFNKVIKSSQKVASVLLKNAKTVELTFDERQEVPHDCVAVDGTQLVCRIEDPVEVGDRLISSANDWLIVAAASEDLFQVPRQQANVEEFLHVAGLSMWPVQLLDDSILLVASHDCMHMLEHFGLSFTQTQGPIVEISVPEIKHDDCCGHDHGHDHDHAHHHDHHDHKHDH